MHTPSWQAVKPPRTQKVPRKYPRYLLSVPVLLWDISGQTPPRAHGLTLDLSQGGIAAAVCGSLHVGQSLRLELRLPTGRVRTLAIVRHGSACRYGFEFLCPGLEFELAVAECVCGLDH